jgi:hypothetical protein
LRIIGNFSEISFIENDFSIDLKHCLDTKRVKMLDYANYIQNEDEQILIDYIQRVNIRGISIRSFRSFGLEFQSIEFS